MAELIRGDLITQEGRTVKFGKSTGRPCPICGDKENGGIMHVRSNIENTAQLECPSCGYTENVPSETVMEFKDIKGRTIKPK